jgi:hypothetical protein
VISNNANAGVLEFAAAATTVHRYGVPGISDVPSDCVSWVSSEESLARDLLEAWV